MGRYLSVLLRPIYTDDKIGQGRQFQLPASLGRRSLSTLFWSNCPNRRRGYFSEICPCRNDCALVRRECKSPSAISRCMVEIDGHGGVQMAAKHSTLVRWECEGIELGEFSELEEDTVYYLIIGKAGETWMRFQVQLQSTTDVAWQTRSASSRKRKRPALSDSPGPEHHYYNDFFSLDESTYKSKAKILFAESTSVRTDVESDRPPRLATNLFPSRKKDPLVLSPRGQTNGGFLDRGSPEDVDVPLAQTTETQPEESDPAYSTALNLEEPHLGMLSSRRRLRYAAHHQSTSPANVAEPSSSRSTDKQYFPARRRLSFAIEETVDQAKRHSNSSDSVLSMPLYQLTSTQFTMQESTQVLTHVKAASKHCQQWTIREWKSARSSTCSFRNSVIDLVLQKNKGQQQSCVPLWLPAFIDPSTELGDA